MKKISAGWLCVAALSIVVMSCSFSLANDEDNGHHPPSRWEENSAGAASTELTTVVIINRLVQGVINTPPVHK